MARDRTSVTVIPTAAAAAKRARTRTDENWLVGRGPGAGLVDVGSAIADTTSMSGEMSRQAEMNRVAAAHPVTEG